MKKNISWIKSGLTGPDILLNGYDYLVSHTYISACLIYKKKLNENLIKEAIENVLASFPVLAGRLVKNKDGLVAIAQNDKGFRFEVKQSKDEYQDYNTENNFSKKIRKYSYSQLRVVDKDAPLGVIIISHFKDKGSVLSFSFPHSMIDSTGIYFIISLTLQIHKQPLPPYTFDRNELQMEGYDFSNENSYDSLVVLSAWEKAKIYSKIAYGMLANKTEHLLLKPDLLKKMSTAGKTYTDEFKISKEDIMAAILWKCIATVRKGKDVPLLSYTVNQRFKTSINTLFFGNASTGMLLYETKDLLKKPISEIAITIRKALKGFNDEYTARETYFLDKYISEGRIGSVMWKELIEAVNDRAVIFDPGHKFPMYSLDLGSGSPSWYEMPSFPLNGFIFTMINPDMASIDLKVCLRKKEMKSFLEIFNKELKAFA